MITHKQFWVVVVAAALAPAAPGQSVTGSLLVGTDTLFGEAQGDHFGWRVAPAGDVNGDGIADLVVGAVSALQGGLQSGRCYLFYGPIDRPMSAEQADVIFHGEDYLDTLYTGVSIDANDDGIADVMLGAPGHDSPVQNAGRVYVFHGPVREGVFDARRANATISGVNEYDRVAAVLAAGDVNGDGIDDAILGCPGASVHGRVFVMYGPLRRRQSVADAGAVVTPALPFENLGIALATADLNGDGRGDLIIGAPAAPIDQTPPGRVYIFFGPVAGTMSAAAADVIIEGEDDNDRLGSAAAAGDFNGDGIADLVVGADQFYYSPGTGKAHVFYGPLQAGFRNARTADAVLTGEVARDQFGFSAASAGDMNGDGFDEVLIGAPGFGDGDAGRAYFFFGPPGGVMHGAEADLTIDGERLDWLGYSVAGVGDVDGDGIADAVLGGPAHPAAEGAGTATVVRPGGSTPAVRKR